MTEHTSVQPNGAQVVGHPVLYWTAPPEIGGLLDEWRRARYTVSTTQMFEASAFEELVVAAQNVESDPDRLYRAIDHHTELAGRIADHRSTEDSQRARVRMILLRRVEQTYLRLDAEADYAEADAREKQMTRDVATRIAVEGRS